MSDYTDEQLWLEAFKSAMKYDFNAETLATLSDAAVIEYRKRWPKVEPVNFPDGSIPRPNRLDVPS
jgi:hypothetical protein